MYGSQLFQLPKNTFSEISRWLPRFKPGKQRIVHCQECKRDFYGPDCFKDHKEAEGKKKVSLCEKYKKCLVCCKHYTVNPKKPHRCYHNTCRHCHEFVNNYEHKCYIQRVEKVLSDKGAEDNEDEKKKMPPLMVVADIECLIEHNVEGRNVFVADLIRYATEDDPQNVSYDFSGDTCIEQFINKLIDLTEVTGKEKQRDLLVMFHNLKGFDSNYIIKELYRQGIKVENQLTNGAKT